MTAGLLTGAALALALVLAAGCASSGGATAADAPGDDAVRDAPRPTAPAEPPDRDRAQDGAAGPWTFERDGWILTARGAGQAVDARAPNPGPYRVVADRRGGLRVEEMPPLSELPGKERELLRAPGAREDRDDAVEEAAEGADPAERHLPVIEILRPHE